MEEEREENWDEGVYLKEIKPILKIKSSSHTWREEKKEGNVSIGCKGFWFKFNVCNCGNDFKISTIDKQDVK